MDDESNTLDKSIKDKKRINIHFILIILIFILLMIFINNIKNNSKSDDINTEIIKGTVIEIGYSDILHGDSDFETKASILVQYSYRDKTYISTLVCSENLEIGDRVDIQITLNEDNTVNESKTILILNNEIKKGA